MKRLQVGRGLRVWLAVVACSLIAAAPALAMPPLPFGPWGAVTIDGSPAPDGAAVTAWIAGVQYGPAALTSAGYYSIEVPGDDPDTPGKEGGANGEVIVFYVNGRRAAPTAIFQSGRPGPPGRLDLVVRAPFTPTQWIRLPLLLAKAS